MLALFVTDFHEMQWRGLAGVVAEEFDESIRADDRLPFTLITGDRES
jgi:hypothetical protein